MPTCALKSPKRTRDSDEVAFPLATSTSSRKTWYCDSTLSAYTCTIHRDRSCSLSFRRQALPSSGTQSTTHSACWGSQVSQHQLEQTLSHQHPSRKFFTTHRSTRQFQNPAALMMTFPQYQGDTAGLRKQVLALFLSGDKTFQFPIARSRQFGPNRVHFLCAAPICLPKRLASALVDLR